MNFRTVLLLTGCCLLLTNGCRSGPIDVRVSWENVAAPLGITVGDLDLDLERYGTWTYAAWIESDGSVWRATSGARHTPNEWVWTVQNVVGAGVHTEPNVCGVRVAWIDGSNVRAWNGSVIDLDSDPAPSSGLQLERQGSLLAAVWLDSRDGVTQPYATYSTDGGLSFSPPERVAQSSLASVNLVDPHLAVRGSRMSVIYRDPATNAVYLSERDIAGTWPNPELRVDDQTGVGETRTPRVALGTTATATHLAWSRDVGEFSIEYNRTDDSGTTFLYGADRPLDAQLGKSNDSPSVLPDIACLGDLVGVCWADDSPLQSLWCSCSTDGGLTWRGVPTRVAGPRAPPGRKSHIGLTDYGMLVAWEDPVGGTADLHAAWSLDDGATFTTPVTLNVGPAKAGSLRIAASPLDTEGLEGNVVCAWIEDRGAGNEIRLRVFTFRKYAVITD